MTSGVFKRTNSHPWDAWFSRKRPFKLTMGEHFHCMPYSMSIQFRQQAKKRGIGIHVSITTDSLLISFFALSIPQGKSRRTL